jgi:hypothetical protein
MKIATLIIPLFTAALSLQVTAQTQDNPASSQGDQTKGKDVVGHPSPKPANPIQTPPSVGQDAAAGNNLVGDNKGQMQNSVTFEQLDQGKKGFLLPADVKSNQALAGKFKGCDSDHDGKLSKDEFGACH